MLSGKSKSGLLIPLVSLLLLFAGMAYFMYLQVVFPRLVPHHGGDERFTLSEANDYTFQIPWSAYSRLHLTLQANNTMGLYVDGEFVCDCSRYVFVIEGGDEVLVSLRSDSPVGGTFTARQETPLGKWLLAFAMILSGLIVAAMSKKLRMVLSK